MASINSGGIVDIFGYKIDLMNEVGRGAFGSVFKGYKDNTTLAVKKVSKKDKQKASAEAVKFHYLKETIVHSQIIKVYDVKSISDAMWIFMDYCDLGDLDQFFKTRSQMPIPTESKIKLMKQIMNGIHFLHSKDIVHRDIKPGNILIKLTEEENALVKLGDFGLSKILDPDDMTSAMSSNVGTLAFKAPEFWDQKPGNKVRYHRNVDVYAAGLTFAAMLQGEPGRKLVPHAEGSLQTSETKMPIGLAAFTRKINKQPDVIVVKTKNNDEKIIKQIKEIILQMTHVNPKQRWSSILLTWKLNSVLSPVSNFHLLSV